MSLKGGRQLRQRLDAIKTVWKPIARKWGRADVAEMRTRVPVRTGRLRRSFRVTSVSGKKVRVGGHFSAYFVDAGPKPHDIRAKSGRLIFQAGGRTIFARKVHHRGYAARPFRARSAHEALEKTGLEKTLYETWNGAA